MVSVPIVDIPIDDSAFREFQALFSKYQDQVNKLPGQWANVNKAAIAQRGTLTKLAEIQAGIGAAVKTMADDERKLNLASEARSRAWHSMARDTASVARHITAATTSLLKWASLTSVFSGLLGAGGLYGIDRLALSAGNARRSAQGIGVSPGEQQAFNINFGRYVDPDALLGNVANARSDYSKRWAFSAMGVNGVNQKDPAQLAAEMAVKAKEIFDRSDQSEQQARAHGLLEFFTMEDLRRLHNTSAAELAASEKDYAKDRGNLGVGDPTLKAWQDFAVQMQRAGQQIENVFIRGLVPLAPELQKLSSAFADTLQSLLSAPELKGWIKDFAAGIHWLGDYIRSGDFKQNVIGFTQDLGVLAKAIGAVARWLGKFIPGVDVPNAPAGAPSAGSSGNVPVDATQDSPFRRWFGWNPNGAPGVGDPGAHPGEQAARPGPSGPIHNPGNLRIPGSTSGFQQFGSDEAGLRAMAHQLQLYEDRDHLDTIAKIITKYAPSNENNTEAYIKAVEDRTQIGRNEHVDLHNNQTLAAIMSAMTKQENSRSDFSPQALITILNSTGGSAVVTVSQLPR